MSGTSKTSSRQLSNWLKHPAGSFLPTSRMSTLPDMSTDSSSPEFTDAMKVADRIWAELRHRLPPTASLIGTADHGLIDYSDDEKVLIRDPKYDGLQFAGDTRGLHLWTDNEVAQDLARLTGGTLIDPKTLLGPNPTETTLGRIGDQLLLAPPAKALLPRGFDKRLRAYHGGLDLAELEIPLLIG